MDRNYSGPCSGCCPNDDPCEVFARDNPSLVVTFSGGTSCPTCQDNYYTYSPTSINGSYTVVGNGEGGWSYTVSGSQKTYTEEGCTGTSTTEEVDLVISVSCDTSFNPPHYYVQAIGGAGVYFDGEGALDMPITANNGCEPAPPGPPVCPGPQGGCGGTATVSLP
jgi:hypothetical protein